MASLEADPPGAGPAGPAPGLRALIEICRTLELTAGKRVERPWKRNGVIPV